MTSQNPLGALRRKVTRALLPRGMLRAAAARRRVHEEIASAGAAFGFAPRIDLYFAFDDPYGVVALPAVMKLANQHRAELTVHPVVERGIPGDPDLFLRRAYALKDAHRLLRRTGKGLTRSVPVAGEEVRFLAEWVMAARASGRAAAFAIEAMNELWLSGSAPIVEARFRPIYEQIVTTAPPPGSADLSARLSRNARELRARGHWETPAARIAGQWFFAHERVEAMEELLARIER